MKKLLGLLLAMLMTCSLGIPVFAKLHLQSVTFGESIQMYTVTDRTNSQWGYEEIEARNDQRRLRPIYFQGELVGQVPVENRSSDWWYDHEEGNLAAGHLVERYGNDLMILEYEQDRFVIFPEQQNTLYPLDQFEDESLTSPVPYEYTLTEYIKAATFLAEQPDITGAQYQVSADSKVDDALVALADEYWDDYWKRQEKISLAVGIGVPSGLILLFGGLALLLWRMGKKGKLKLNLSLTHSLWNYPLAALQNKLQGFVGR